LCARAHQVDLERRESIGTLPVPRRVDVEMMPACDISPIAATS